jgi:hypothetical protein
MRIEPAEPDDVPRLLEIRHAASAAHATDAYSAEEVATLPADVDPDELRRTAWDSSVYLEMQKEL